MRLHPLLLLATILLLPAWAPATALGPLFPQDDAGTGADAPNTFQHGWRLQPGSYTGRLVGVLRPAEVNEAPFDQEDWYRFLVHKGDQVTAILDGQESNEVEMPLYSIRLRLVDPDERLAGAEAVGSPQEVRNFSVVADKTGWWGVHLYTESGGGKYRFTISLSTSENALDFTGAGGGLHVFAFRVHEGATLRGAYESFYFTPDFSEPTSIKFMTLRLDDNQATLFYTRDLGSNVEPAANLHVAGQTLQVSQAVEGRTVFHRDSGPENVLEPGLYAMIAIMSRAETAFQYRSITIEGQVDFLGARHGTIEDLLLLRHEDFQGTLGAANSLVTVSYELRVQVSIEHDIVGLYGCASGAAATCRIIHPNGFTQVLQVANALLDNAEPGVWTFTRDVEASVRAAKPNQYFLVAADVDLDWARNGGDAPFPQCDDEAAPKCPSRAEG